VPAFTSKQTTPPISPAIRSLTKQKSSDRINPPISDYQNAQSGTLYFTHKQSEQGETIKVGIEYQQQLDFHQQQYNLRFPMSITPRYLPSVTTGELETQSATYQSR
tara:strand:+ start:1460 stop:1777 length:318 start_codon:yes stop_codon:yes gene_type:complete